MNTSFSSSLTIPPRFVWAPPEAQGGDSREAVGPGWPGGGAFQLLRSSREISPSSNTAGECGSVRRSTIRRAGASSGHWAPRVGWRGLGSKGREPSLRRWGFGKVPCPDEVGQEEGNRPGHPHPPLFLQSPGRWARTPTCSGAVPWAPGLQARSGRSSAGRVPPLCGSVVALLPGAVRCLSFTWWFLPCRACSPAIGHL